MIHLRVVVCIGACALLGCGRKPAGDATANFEGPPVPVAHEALVLTTGDYCRIVAQPGLAHWDRDVITTCPGAGAGNEGAGCRVAELGGATPRAVDVPTVRLALRADGHTLVVLHTNGALTWRDTSGRETPIAAWASEPSVSPDGVRVAFVTLGEGVVAPRDGHFVPGTATRIVVHDLRDGRVRVIADDTSASTPWVVPNSDDVVYVSSRSGLASIWRGNGEYEIQVTNIGVEAGDQGVLPTFGRHAVWVSEARRLVFEASAPSNSVWSYDVSRAAVESMGPGGWPQIGANGTVLAARHQSGDASCAISYRSADH